MDSTIEMKKPRPLAVSLGDGNVELEAPSDLPADSELTVQMEDGTTCTVRVPKEGAQKGEFFHATVVQKASISGGGGGGGPIDSNAHHIPTGSWRDGLCDCCTHGICHPACCCCCWAPLALLGQVLSRMNLSLMGTPVISRTFSSPFKTLLFGWIAYMVFEYIMWGLQISYAGSAMPGWLAFLVFVNSVLRIAVFVYIILAVCRTRRHIRSTYGIPEQRCHGMEDCCCACWCPSCTIGQLARHTADYRTCKAKCCSETGVSDSVTFAPPAGDVSIV